MVCAGSCMISLIFIIGMIYFYSMTGNNAVVNKYKDQLTPELKDKYESIKNERMKISYQGYILGFILSIGIILYNFKLKGTKLNNLSLICITIATMFTINYFYYMLHPKKDWMLNHLQNKDEIKGWLEMYREMQFNYHMGLTLGIIAVGILAFAFRC